MATTLRKIPVGTRDSLLAAGEELFIARGFSAVSTREIAERAGVNLGSIQYYFGSKARLFSETIQRMMEFNAANNTELHELSNVQSREHATGNLVRFISGYLDRLLHPQGPQACRLIFREILNDTTEEREMFETLHSAVVENFSRPLLHTLISIMGVINPQLSKEDLEMSAQMVLGQCSFYLTHRPFIERLQGIDFEESSQFTKLVTGVATFSLRGLGCEESLISAAIKEWNTAPRLKQDKRNNRN